MRSAAARSGFGNVRPGRVLYEMEGVTPAVAREALRLAAHKLPIPTRVIERTEV
jgi:large subunit ribosomal protein L16